MGKVAKQYFLFLKLFRSDAIDLPNPAGWLNKKQRKVQLMSEFIISEIVAKFQIPLVNSIGCLMSPSKLIKEFQNRKYLFGDKLWSRIFWSTVYGFSMKWAIRQIWQGTYGHWCYIIWMKTCSLYKFVFFSVTSWTMCTEEVVEILKIKKYP